LEAELPQGIRPLSSPRVFLGDIAPGTSSTLTLSLVPEEGAGEGVREVWLVVKYADNLNNQYEDRVRMEVSIGAGEKPQAGGGEAASGATQREEGGSPVGVGLNFYEAVIVVVLVVVVAYVLRRVLGGRGSE